MLLLTFILLVVAAPTEGDGVQDDSACSKAYEQWMSVLADRFDTFTRASLSPASGQYSVDSLGNAAHGEKHDFNDALDLRFAAADILTRGGDGDDQLPDDDDDEFFHEYVSGGRLVKEDYMIMHLRAYKRRDMRHQHQVYHDRVDRHREHVVNSTRKHKVKQFVGSVWQWWARWIWKHSMIGLDVVAFLVLIVVPWRMLLEMQVQKPPGMSRGRSRNHRVAAGGGA